MNDVVLRLRDVSVGYGDRAVVRGANLTVHRGDVIAVVGANGSGKTTLMRGILGLATVLSGQLQVLGDPPGAPRDRGRLGYVPQRHSVGGTIPSTVREVVSSGRLPRLSLFARPRAADRAAVRAAIDAVDLTPWADTDIAQLSGGQQRRALIARALASEPEVMIMDEPTAGVDRASQRALAATIARLVTRGVTLLIVLHELGPLADVVTRTVVVRDGRLVDDGMASSMDGHRHHTHHGFHDDTDYDTDAHHEPDPHDPFDHDPSDPAHGDGPGPVAGLEPPLGER